MASEWLVLPLATSASMADLAALALPDSGASTLAAEAAVGDDAVERAVGALVDDVDEELGGRLQVGGRLALHAAGAVEHELDVHRIAGDAGLAVERERHRKRTAARDVGGAERLASGHRPTAGGRRQAARGGQRGEQRDRRHHRRTAVLSNRSRHSITSRMRAENGVPAFAGTTISGRAADGIEMPRLVVTSLEQATIQRRGGKNVEPARPNVTARRAQGPSAEENGERRVC
jgi:hypothetical protein